MKGGMFMKKLAKCKKDSYSQIKKVLFFFFILLLLFTLVFVYKCSFKDESSTVSAPIVDSPIEEKIPSQFL